jgi:hypothetical protein
MGLVSALLVGLGGAAAERLTRPKMPKATPYTPLDVEKEAEANLVAREARRDPRLTDLINTTTESASALSRGELPAAVLRQIKRTSLENAATRGLSADQTTILTAQSIGVNQLQAMQTGATLMGQVEEIRRNDWAVSYNSALAKSIREYERYAMSENARYAQWAQKSKQNTSFWGGLTTAGAAAAKDFDDKKLTDFFKRTPATGTVAPTTPVTDARSKHFRLTL